MSLDEECDVVHTSFLFFSEKPEVRLSLLLCLNSDSESFGGAFKSQLLHNGAWRLSQSEGSSRGSFFSLLLEDAPLRSFVASHIPRLFVCPKKNEREKMATSRVVDRALSRAWAAEIVT